MYLLVIYDVVDDKVRNKVAETCKDYGLSRIQYSAFWGHVSRNYWEEMRLRFRKLLADSPGRVHIFPINDVDRQKIMKIEHELESMGLDFGEGMG